MPVLKCGEDTFERWERENRKVHRGMLLYMMMSTGSDPRYTRSYRAVARALGVSEASVRGWAKAHRWFEREKGTLAHPQRAAVAMYRALYLTEFGKLDLPHVADRVDVPLTGEVTEGSVDELDAQVKKASPLGKHAAAKVEAIVGTAIADRRANDRLAVERQTVLVDAVLATAAKQLREGKLRVNARDIGPLVEVRQRLADWLVSQDRSEQKNRPVETARVQLAREMGGDVLDAMLEDVQELSAIVTVLVTRRDAESAAALLDTSSVVAAAGK